MLDAEERMEISVLSKHGGSIRSIARATGRSRNTIRRYLRGGSDIAARRKPATKRIAKLDPFKDYIQERLRAAAPDKIPAVVLFREIRQRGYRGGQTRVKDFVRSLQPPPQPDPVRFETGPGQQIAEPIGPRSGTARTGYRFLWQRQINPRSIGFHCTRSS